MGTDTFMTRIWSWALALALAGVAVAVALIMRDEALIASVAIGQSSRNVIETMGDPGILIAGSNLTNPLFEPPAACAPKRPAFAYVYHRSWGRRAVIVYFDSAESVICVGRRGIGVARHR